jgi:hypothetical protein
MNPNTQALKDSLHSLDTIIALLTAADTNDHDGGAQHLTHLNHQELTHALILTTTIFAALLTQTFGSWQPTITQIRTVTAQALTDQQTDS